jgi:hypothetical protein
MRKYTEPNLPLQLIFLVQVRLEPTTMKRLMGLHSKSDACKYETIVEVNSSGKTL